MASATSLLTVENFHCSICLCVFTKPVSIPCGHNYCLVCITDYWDTQDIVFQCPLCKEMFPNKPMLRVNTVLAEMAAKFKNPAHEECSGTSEQAENGNVLCGLCVGLKHEALKSCLVCLESYCEKHLERHLKTPALKEHKLINPVENPESRICKTHHKPLELFCTVEQMFICESCRTTEHKAHKIVPVEEEAEMQKMQVGVERKITDQMVKDREQKIHEIQNSMDTSRKNASKVLLYSTDVVTATVDYIKKCQAALSEVIMTKQTKNEVLAENIIKELTGEITQIKQKSSQLNQILLHDDPFIFLESVLSLTIPAPDVKDWSDVTVDSDLLPVQEALAKLEAMVTREVSLLCDPDLKKKQQYAVDVTLDPDTANAALTVSEDGKEVSHRDRRKNLPNKPERFDHVLNVLAKEGFSRGKFYYEVQVKDKKQWELGVANQSINRKGDIRLSPKNGYWTICLRKEQGLTANVGPAINLQVREMPQKVGVFVDYVGGEVSFYDADSRAKIFSFTGCNFTEMIFPFFSPCANDGGKNSAPLIITPVQFSS